MKTPRTEKNRMNFVRRRLQKKICGIKALFGLTLLFPAITYQRLQRFAPNVLHLHLTRSMDLSKSASTFIRLVAPWLIGPELAGLMRPGLDLPGFATAGLRWTQGSRSSAFWILGFKAVWFYRIFDPLLFKTLVSSFFRFLHIHRPFTSIFFLLVRLSRFLY